MASVSFSPSCASMNHRDSNQAYHHWSKPLLIPLWSGSMGETRIHGRKGASALLNGLTTSTAKRSSKSGYPGSTSWYRRPGSSTFSSTTVTRLRPKEDDRNTPPPFVKTIRDVVYYYYAKPVIAPSAGLAGNYGFIVDRFKVLKAGKVSNRNNYGLQEALGG